MKAVEVRTELEAFIRKRFKVKDGDPRFTTSVHLLEAGYIDSLNALEVVNFLEKRFKVRFSDDVLQTATDVSIDGLTALVVRLAGGETPD